MKLDCPSCERYRDIVLERQYCTNGTIHIRASCSDCGKFLKFVKQEPQLDIEKLNIYDPQKQLELL